MQTFCQTDALIRSVLSIEGGYRGGNQACRTFDGLVYFGNLIKVAVEL